MILVQNQASWWNGRHKGLKILALLGVPVQVRPRLPIFNYMYAFITIGTNNLKKSSFFYTKLLKQLNIRKALTHKRYIGYAKVGSLKKIELYIIKPYNKKKATFGNGSMITFSARSKKIVDQFYNIGIKLGAKDEGKPGPRHGKDYYAYLRDLDGNKICVYKKI